MKINTIAIDSEVHFYYACIKHRLDAERNMYSLHLKSFITVAESGSFAKAAEKLYITPTALIQQINIFEDRCGFRLFERSNHGVRLTPAGKSIYEDAKTIIKLSDEAIERARKISEAAETTVRIGTSILFKTRMLIDICSSVSEKLPNMRYEIVPLTEYLTRDESFSLLGTKFDILEGIYCDIGWKGICRFLELKRTPICCAVSKRHRLSKMKIITLSDLNGEDVTMPISGISSEIDTLRNIISTEHPTITIKDSHYYGIDTFTECEMNLSVLITEDVYSDIHPDLVSIPLDTDLTLPYGLIYANNPTPAMSRFIEEAEKNFMA